MIFLFCGVTVVAVAVVLTTAAPLARACLLSSRARLTNQRERDSSLSRITARRGLNYCTTVRAKAAGTWVIRAF